MQVLFHRIHCRRKLLLLCLWISFFNLCLFGLSTQSDAINNHGRTQACLQDILIWFQSLCLESHLEAEFVRTYLVRLVSIISFWMIHTCLISLVLSFFMIFFEINVSQGRFATRINRRWIVLRLNSEWWIRLLFRVAFNLLLSQSLSFLVKAVSISCNWINMRSIFWICVCCSDEWKAHFLVIYFKAFSSLVYLSRIDK